MEKDILSNLISDPYSATVSELIRLNALEKSKPDILRNTSPFSNINKQITQLYNKKEEFAKTHTKELISFMQQHMRDIISHISMIDENLINLQKLPDKRLEHFQLINESISQLSSLRTEYINSLHNLHLLQYTSLKHEMLPESQIIDAVNIVAREHDKNNLGY